MLPADTQAALLERSGGNPLYAEEFVRMLSDRGILVRRGRILEIASGPEIPVPESVHALIAARLDTLTTNRKELLHDAAVVGKVFWAGAVASVGGLDEYAVQEGLHELVRKELVRPARTSSVEGQDEFSFWHFLIRDVAYHQIPRAARARRHKSAAQWIEHIAEDRVADQAEILAHHYGQALDLARAAGAAEDEGELELSTRRFLVMAGDRAFALDVGRAESYYRRALELLPPRQPERAAVLTKAAEAAWIGGRFAEAEEGYEEAIAELRDQGNPLGVGAAMVSLSLVHGFRGETRRGRALLAEVVELLEHEPPGRELASAYAQTAREHMLAGRFEECVDWSAKALTLAERLRLKDLAVMALQFRGCSRCLLGDIGGLDDLSQALRTSLELGLGQETVRAHINLGEHLWLSEGPAQGLELYRAGIAFGEGRGITGPMMWSKGETLWLLFDLGDWEELLQTAEELISWERVHGASYFGVMALSYKAQVLVRRGAVDDAYSLAQEFLPRARTIGDPQILAPALSIAALTEHARGRSSAALALVEEFGEATEEHPSYRANHVTDAVRICSAEDRMPMAKTLLDGISVGLARHRCALLTAQAVLAEAEGHFEQAGERYSEAVQRWSDYGFVLEQALALLGLGRCRVALGRADANGALAAARELFVSLGTQPLVTETDELLAEAVTARS